MFGYIKAFKDELKVKDFEFFKAYYCGLCKTLKKEYGYLSSFGLSYDLTFLSVLLSSVYDENESVASGTCIANPFKKKPILKTNRFLSYAAAANVMLTYFKLRDDISDNHSIKSILFMPLIYPSVKKAKKRHPELMKTIHTSMDKLKHLEKMKCADIELLAHEFASITKTIFSSVGIEDEKTYRIMSQLGYYLGRYIYLLDVYDDVEKDKKNGSFNVLLLKDNKITKNELFESLEFTLSEVSSAYNLLSIKKNKPLLDNIIYLGLMDSLSKVTKSKKGEIINE